MDPHNLTPEAGLPEVGATDARSAAALLAAVVQSSDDAILSKTLDGVITSWNPAAECLFGWTAAEAIGRHVSFLIPPDRAGELAENMARLRAGESVGYFETVRVHRDGSRIDVALTISRVRDANGRLVGVSKTARDIRERKRAEDALRRSEERYRGLIESIPSLVWVFDTTGRPLLHNRRWFEYTGQTPEDTAADRWHQAIHPDDAAGAVAAWEGCKASGEPYSYEYRLRRADGAYRWFLSQGTAQQVPGGVEQWIGTCTDIDDRKRAEEDLRRAAAILRAVTDGTPDAVFVKDRAGRYLLFNPAASQVVGRPAEDVLGRDDTALFGPDDASLVMARDRRVMESGRAETQEEVLTAAGVTRTYLAMKAPYRDAAGNIIGTFGVSRDVTDQKRAAESLVLSERRYRRLFEAAQDGILIVDPGSRRVVDVNPFLADLIGYRRDEVVGKELWEIGLFRDAEANKAAFQTLQEAGYVRYDDLPLRNKDGRQVDVEFVSNMYDVGDARVIQCNIRDITDWKRTAAELRLFRALIDRTTDAIEVIDPDTGRFLDVNEAACAAHGYTRAEYLGLSVPDVDAQGGGSWLHLVESRQLATARTVESRHRRKDGSTFPVEVSLNPICLDRDYLVAVVRDVTDRERAEAALRASEERFRAFMDHSPAAAFIKDGGGRYLYVNPTWRRQFDPEPTVWEGKTDHDFWPRETADVFRASDLACAAEGVAVQMEETGRTAGGAEVTWLVMKFPLAAGGELVGGMAWDISDRKRAQAERDELLARLTLQIERMPLAYLLSGPDFRYTRWNPAAERTFGFSEVEALGRHPFDVVVPPQSQAVVADVFARLAAGEMNAHGGCENVTKDGRTITCEWYNTPLFGPDGAFQGVLSLAQDVTARRQAEQALRMRDRAIRAATQGLVITDPNRPDNPIVYVNPGFERTTGYTSEEVLGRNCRLLNGKDTDPAVSTRMRRAVRDAEPFAGELLNYRKDGTPFWNELSISPVRDDAGRLTHFVGVQTDVTARRALEDQFRQAQKMEAFGQLAGGVAHDFNNLLTIINGYSELVLERLPPGDPSREMVAEVLSAGERSAGLTRQLLAFSRQQVLAPQVIDLNGVVADTDKMLGRLIGEDIRLATVLNPLLDAVRADPGQVEQVIMNLAVNARDAMPRGGGLTIETRNVELDEGYARSHSDARPGPHVLLAVSDTGTGMPPEVAARVFEPFFTTKGPGRGTGLGLATVYGIVRQSGGHVAVYSEVGVGTTFKVYFPRADQAAGGSKTRPVTRTLPRGAETVLVAEDEAAVRALTRRVLAGCGYTVLEAADGDEAVRVAAGHGGPVDLLITDVVMPGLGGRSVAERVAGRHPGVRVLYVSGYTDDAIIRHGVLRDGVEFLQKPFTPAGLASKVREVLDTRAPRG